MTDKSARFVGVAVAAFLVIGAALVGRRLVPTASSRTPAATVSPARPIEVADAGIVAFDPVPAAPLWAKSFYFDVALSWDEPPKEKVKAQLASIASLRPFSRLENPAPATDDKASFVMVEGPAVGDLAPMSAASLKYFAVELSEADRRAYLGAKMCAAFSFHGPIDAGFATLRAALNGVRELADNTSSIVTDGSTRQVFSRASWASRVDAWTNGVPKLSKHIAIHGYPNGGLIRVVTLGMAKFGLPDIAAEEIAREQSQRMSDLVLLVAQTLVERGKLDRAGELEIAIDELKARPDLGDFAPKATKRGVVSLGIAKPKEGDADNRLIQIVFPGSANGVQQRQAKLLEGIFGARDEMVQVDGSDGEIAAASARARAKLLTLKPAWSNGPPGLDDLIVKAPFQTPDGRSEWMWVEVTGWSGTKIKGILQNDAYEIPGLVVGTHVEVEESSIFDYMLKHPDGSIEGGETNALITKGAKK
ncbi:MAG: DUF2314 domain-containing protein [Deltaproteobacteria bacterium]|nr:DUF2314 domain-containing protein [Deltaproteobacteria bacterium]